MDKFIIEKVKELQGWSIKGEGSQIVGYDHTIHGDGRSISELVITDIALKALMDNCYGRSSFQV